MVLPGGPPFQEDVVMWGNFIGRSHEDIVRTREAWKSESDRFGRVEGATGTVCPRRPAPRHHHTSQEPRTVMSLRPPARCRPAAVCRTPYAGRRMPDAGAGAPATSRPQPA
ncbi:hypothetical protein ACIOWI_28845 [Streptomyces sp. NPDC087659]|uniref:hypothetical protein n=1 Tax=Streptomyces sp. NPDC087659 TaxID=3365801 RepID=UPI0037F7904F